MGFLDKVSSKKNRHLTQKTEKEDSVKSPTQDLLASLRLTITSKEDREKLYFALGNLPSIWCKVTGESETVSVSDVGVFEPDYMPRTTLDITYKANNRAAFEFYFLIGDDDNECANFIVEGSAEINLREIIYFIGDEKISSSEHQWEQLLVMAIIRKAEKEWSL